MERFDQDVPVEHYFAHRDLNHPDDIEELVESLIYGLESGYFRMWEAVVRQEQGLSLTEDQEEALSGLISFGDEDEDDRILYIDERARPDVFWYQYILGKQHQQPIRPDNFSFFGYRDKSICVTIECDANIGFL